MIEWYKYLIVRMEERHALRHKELLYLMENKEEVFRQKVEADLVEMVYASLENLPKKCRNILKLTLAGISYEEIAARLHISVSTFKSHFFIFSIVLYL